MSKTLSILFLILSFNLKSQKAICDHMTSQKECVLVNLALNEFIEDTNVIVIYNGLTPLHPRVEGITWRYTKEIYSINLNMYAGFFTDRRWTILHEVGHVIDLYYGNLTISPVTWKGKPVEREDIPWNERPWEISADEWAHKLWHRLIDEPKPDLNKE